MPSWYLGVALVVAASGASCAVLDGLSGETPSPDQTDQPPGTDGGSDEPSPPGARCRDWQRPLPGDIAPCAMPDPVGSVALSGPEPFVYDTSRKLLTLGGVPVSPQPAATLLSDGGGIVIMAVDALLLEGKLRVVGDFPLVIASYSSISIPGILDVSSDQGGPLGPGAIRASGCKRTEEQAGSDVPFDPEFGGGGGGGGGGGFGGPGGVGGTGITADGTAPAGGLPGTESLATLRAGCPGGNGGRRDFEVAAAEGGGGGGAVHLIALETIDVAGRIDAGGAGGQAISSDNGVGGGGGGGGGGSGGFVGLDAPTLVLAPRAIITAHGGGGGEGSSDAGEAQPGNNGDGPVAAAGGSADPFGGDGGSGNAATQAVGIPGKAGRPDQQFGAGGGGGGGGGGFIVLVSVNELDGDPFTVPISPEPTFVEALPAGAN